MRIVGTYRAVEAQEVEIKPDRLVKEGLMERKSLTIQRTGKHADVLVLTPKGRDLARALTPDGSAQRYYAGMVKPAEAAHDLAIQPACQEMIEEIEAKGGTVTRVVLDFELKGKAARLMNQPGPESQDECRAQAAAELDLPIIDDHLSIPDARIEYTDRDGNAQHVDVEVVTHNYRGSHMASKKQSGFRLVKADSKGPRYKVNDDHHLHWL